MGHGQRANRCSSIERSGASLIHYQLNTGETNPEPRQNISDAVLRLLTSLYEPGNHPFPVMEYQAEVVETLAGCFCLVVDERKELPLIAVAVAEDHVAAGRLWPDLVRYYEIMKTWNGTVPVSTASISQPTPAPWYATMEIFVNADDAGFLQEFARHFAWGWIDQQRWREVWSNRQRFS